MASQKVGLAPPHRLDNGINSQLVFQDESNPFNRPSAVSATAPLPHHAGEPGPRTRELSGFMDEKLFSVDRDRYFAPTQGPELRRSMLAEAATDRRDHPESQNWRGGTPTSSGDGSGEDDDDEEEEEEEDDEGDGEVEGFVALNNSNHDKNGNSNSSDSIRSCAAEKKIGTANAKHHSSLGSNGEMLPKDNNIVRSVNDNTSVRTNENCQQLRVSNYQNAIRIAEPVGEMYYTQFLQGPEGSAARQKDFGVENGCSFSGRKDVVDSSESGESLRAILSDPVTGSLMEDAMILPCGHSFGSNGIQQVLRMKTCVTCSQPISEDSVAPNLSLRAAVQAFRREEESQLYRASKKRRERYEQDKGNCGDSFMDPPRGRGVQFPFAVTDRVIIKGNKRTPERFVGREAVVTTQCLNGWYVVKTLDNAESVKLQYRSLAKVSDNSASRPTSSKTSNWL